MTPASSAREARVGSIFVYERILQDYQRHLPYFLFHDTSHDITKKYEDVTKTNSYTSEARITQEFVLTGQNECYEVMDLTLGAVDTPGFQDTDGIEQDACNLYSIRQFYDTHPQCRGCYPNPIFLLIQATDGRYKDSDSNFIKAIKCLKMFDLVDIEHPNVVAVMTHCCSSSLSANKHTSDWIMEMETKKANYREIIFETLEIAVPVVLLENEFKELPRPRQGLFGKSDYTRLPNGELQSENLFLACDEVFRNKSDMLGGNVTLSMKGHIAKSKDGRPIGFVGTRRDVEKIDSTNLLWPLR